MPYRPKWFRDDQVVMSNAATCGINKDGNEQYVVDPTTGQRSNIIDDRLFADAQAIRTGKLESPSIIVRPLAKVLESKVLSPTYFDHSTVQAFERFVAGLTGFTSASLEELRERGLISVRKGHGSPSKDQRLGDVPYIKVSDLRAGHVNINPTNMVPLALAEHFWKGSESGLRAYDLISPERASSNIGEFCVLMPGQERVVLTKEMIIVRAENEAPFDQFFLMWALSLTVVRDQWRRVVLMQTNREDVGDRAFEVRIPVPPSKGIAADVSNPFRGYYTALEAARERFMSQLRDSPYEHHVFLE